MNTDSFDFSFFATNNEDVWYSDDGGATYKTIKNVASAIAPLIPETGSMTFYFNDPDLPPVELNDCDISSASWVRAVGGLSGPP